MSDFFSTAKKGIVAMIKALVGPKNMAARDSKMLRQHKLQQHPGGINYNSTQATQETNKKNPI
jgi:hypothetical protein